MLLDLPNDGIHAQVQGLSGPQSAASEWRCPQYLCTRDCPRSDIRYVLKSVIFLLAFYLSTICVGSKPPPIPYLKDWLIHVEQQQFILREQYNRNPRAQYACGSRLLELSILYIKRFLTFAA